MKKSSKYLHEFLRKNMELAINDYQMIKSGDRILVGVSGGVDSFTLLRLLTGKKVFIPSDISILAVHLDMGFNKYPDDDLNKLQQYFLATGYNFVIEKTDIGQLAHSEFNRHNPCFLCSRMRRKRIFEIAEQHNCNKIAYGHHKDDIIETLLINMFYGREISTMMPNQPLFDGAYHIIRPLCYSWERKIKEYAAKQDFPLIDNNCPTSPYSKRQVIKDMLNDLSRDHRLIKENIYKSMRHIKPDYLP